MNGLEQMNMPSDLTWQEPSLEISNVWGSYIKKGLLSESEEGENREDVGIVPGRVPAQGTTRIL